MGRGGGGEVVERGGRQRGRLAKWRDSDRAMMVDVYFSVCHPGIRDLLDEAPHCGDRSDTI